MRRYVRARDVLWRRTCDRVVLLVPSSGELVTLEGTGVDLWAELSEPRTVELIAATLAERFHTKATVIERDVATTLAELVGRGAVGTVP